MDEIIILLVLAAAAFGIFVLIDHNTETTPGNSCTPNWQCTSWSACSGGTQTRGCVDNNACGTTTGKPATTQTCQADNEDQTYLDYLNEHEDIADLTLDVYDEETKTYFWDYVDQLENNHAIVLTRPSDWDDSYIYYTATEYKKTLAAKAAHAIWLDKNHLVPWSLNTYNEEELRTLFDYHYLFETVGSDHYQYGISDHNPTEAYAYAKNLAAPTQQSTVNSILSEVKDFRHGITDRDAVDTPQTLQHELLTYDSITGRRVSMHGCHTMVDTVVALARSLNIPAYKQKGWYAGEGHASAIIPGIGVLNHGDDIYSSYLTAVPISELLMPWNYFEQNVEPCGTYTECAQTQTLRYEGILATSHPAPYMVTRCCGPYDSYEWSSCQQYFEEGFSYGQYLTAQELSSAVNQVQNMC